MPEKQHPGARNPKLWRFTVALSDEMNSRLEALADASGMNKSTMAAFCVAAGVVSLEALFHLKMEEAIAAAKAAKVRQVERDMSEVRSSL